jgi:multiple sugar transport system substrate-binding protein
MFHTRADFRVPVVLSLLVFVAAACGGGSSSSPSSSGGPVSSLGASLAAQKTAAPSTAASPSAPGSASSSPEGSGATGSASASASSGPVGSTQGSGGPTGSSAPLQGGFSGDIFAFGITYEQADEIGKTRIDYFKQLNPDVNLTVSEADFSSDQFLTAMQDESNAPDVVRMNTSDLATYVARGVLAPLDECFSTMGVDVAGTFYAAPLSQATINGQVYGAPEFLTTQNWFINQSAFTDAGLDASTFDFSNWDTIKTANDSLLQMNGSDITRIGIDPKLPEYFPLWAKANGVDLVSADGKTAQLNSPQAVEALQFTVDLINAHGGSQPFDAFKQSWDFFGAENELAKDQVAAFPFEQFYLSSLAGVSPDIDLTVKPFVDRQGNGLTYATGQSLAVTSKTSDPEAACAFVATLTNADAWVKAAEARKQIRASSDPPKPNTGVYSANQVANERMFSEVNPPDEMPAPFGDAVKVVIENAQHAFALPPSPGNAAIFTGTNSIVSQAVARALAGENMQAVLDDANQQAQQAIDDAGASQ